VLDPTTPPATLGRLLRTLAPTHLVDPDVVCLPLHASSPPDLDTLRTFARHQLARAQLPKQLVLVEGIPRSPGGKVLRRKPGPPE
jgi:acyl-CoA synthetase (AMP-forming)/AMP-acid ligase II